MKKKVFASTILDAINKGCSKNYSIDDLRIKEIENKYGVNKDVFKVSVEDKQYFIKIPNKRQNPNTNLLSNYLQIPKNYYFQNDSDGTLILDEYINGELLTNLVLRAEKSSDTERILATENDKNIRLLGMYQMTSRDLKYSEIVKSEANKLFFERLLGSRYQEYYDNVQFKELFSKELIINGKTYESVNDTISKLKQKYLDINPNILVKTVLGHGDAHHQNILIEEGSDEIYFIDHEYNSFIPINMELAKPYYIDLLGNYFFFFNEELLKHIVVVNFSISDKEIQIDIRTKKIPKLKIDLAKSKIDTFNTLLNDCNDPISLNEYLLLCHMLSRNPSQYQKEVSPIFLAYIPIISNFDIYIPEELLKF